TWYAVEYKYAGAVVIGWVSSGFLSTKDRVRVGYEPEKVPELFDAQLNQEVRDAGGKLMSVRTDWLQIQDGPTNDYAVPAAPEWGRVVRWTGSYLEKDGNTWYEVIYDDETRGWARSDRMENYVSIADAPATEEGKIWVQLQQERSFSQYNLYDVDNYVPPNNDFAKSVPIRWKYNIGPQDVDVAVEVPYGSLYGPDGVAMQGSGEVTVDVIDPATGEIQERTVQFTLDNPRDLEWKNGAGDPTKWEDESWTNGQPAEIANPDDARFRPYSKTADLTSGVSLAGPPEYRGQRIWAPDLAGSLTNNPEAVFTVEDAGGAFPHGSLRYDLYFEDGMEGSDWYSRAKRLGIPVYVEQDIPPELEESSSP
ncbi:MAG: hypothetical protein ACC700_10385, partial [Anaerolineales bacterium]